MSDFIDTVSGVMVGNALSGSDHSGQRDVAAETRAKNIEDNFGVKPESLGSYRNSHGGSGILKALLWVGAGLAVGALFNVAAVGLAIGAVIGAISVTSHREKVRTEYSGYLDNVSAQARAMQGRERSANIEYNNGTGKNFSQDVLAERQKQANQTQTR